MIETLVSRATVLGLTGDSFGMSSRASENGFAGAPNRFAAWLTTKPAPGIVSGSRARRRTGRLRLVLLN
jgi:hypothetical protein